MFLILIIVFYLNDGTLGGRYDVVLRDLSVVEREAAKLGLQLSVAKSKVICRDSSTLDNFLAAAPGFHVTPPDHATLLCPLLAPQLTIVSRRR